MAAANVPMTAKEYNEALRKLGLSVYASPKVLGISLRQSQRYSSGEQAVAQPIANHLRLLMVHFQSLHKRQHELLEGIRVIESGSVRYYSDRKDTTAKTLHELKRQLSELEKLLANHPSGLTPSLD